MSDLQEPMPSEPSAAALLERAEPILQGLEAPGRTAARGGFPLQNPLLACSALPLRIPQSCPSIHGKKQMAFPAGFPAV